MLHKLNKWLAFGYHRQEFPMVLVHGCYINNLFVWIAFHIMVNVDRYIFHGIRRRRRCVYISPAVRPVRSPMSLWASSHRVWNVPSLSVRW
jgi:hypothetical protein